MTSAPVHLTGPTEETRHVYGPTLNALRGVLLEAEMLLEAQGEQKRGAVS